SVDRRHRTPISGFLDRWARAARGRSRPSHRQCRWPSLPTIHPVRHNSSWLLLLMVVAAHTDHVLPFARSSHPTDSAEPQSPHLNWFSLSISVRSFCSFESLPSHTPFIQPVWVSLVSGSHVRHRVLVVSVLCL